jgi:predicted enzyme related to lactoylglutathione lyase
MKRPVHFEILADDPKQIAGFYESLFGWEIATWDGGEQSYWLVTTGPDDVPGINGGIMQRSLHQGVINTLEVESIEDMLKSVEVNGGKLIHGPNEVPGVGLHAYCADPEGKLFGMMQPNPQNG